MSRSTASLQHLLRVASLGLAASAITIGCSTQPAAKNSTTSPRPSHLWQSAEQWLPPTVILFAGPAGQTVSSVGDMEPLPLEHELFQARLISNDLFTAWIDVQTLWPPTPGHYETHSSPGGVPYFLDLVSTKYR